ncbi:MAG: M56 family metallopeptidase [Acetatifactor sp.]|nr:M56 family metallopeptidase [Acetatifactor sp.]
MYFSFSSVLMTLLASNLLLIPISLLFRNEKLLAEIGYKVMTVFCIVTLVRLLFPCELPFTKTVILPALVSDAISLLRHEHDFVAGLHISIVTFLCMGWFVISIFFLISYALRQKKLRALVLRNGRDVTGKDPYAAILRALCSEKERRHLRLRLFPFTETTMITGLRKPIILLPKDMAPTKRNLLFSLRHELYHYRHHHLWLKFLVGCVSAFYWWNPFCHILSRQVDALQEMQVDASIVADGDEAATGYMSTIMYYLKNSKSGGDYFSQSGEPIFDGKNILTRRIHMMQRPQTKPNYLVSVALLLLVFGMYIGSYLIVFENYSYMPEITESESYVVPESTNTYAIPNADGTYTVYLFDGRCTEIVDSLEYYPDIIVYSSKEEHDETVQKDQ